MVIQTSARMARLRLLIHTIANHRADNFINIARDVLNLIIL